MFCKTFSGTARAQGYHLEISWQETLQCVSPHHRELWWWIRNRNCGSPHYNSYSGKTQRQRTRSKRYSKLKPRRGFLHHASECIQAKRNRWRYNTVRFLVPVVNSPHSFPVMNPEAVANPSSWRRSIRVPPLPRLENPTFLPQRYAMTALLGLLRQLHSRAHKKRLVRLVPIARKHKKKRGEIDCMRLRKIYLILLMEQFSITLYLPKLSLIGTLAFWKPQVELNSIGLCYVRTFAQPG